VNFIKHPPQPQLEGRYVRHFHHLMHQHVVAPTIKAYQDFEGRFKDKNGTEMIIDITLLELDEETLFEGMKKTGDKGVRRHPRAV
jgi:hypothetical protein